MAAEMRRFVRYRCIGRSAGRRLRSARAGNYNAAFWMGAKGRSADAMQVWSRKASLERPARQCAVKWATEHRAWFPLQLDAHRIRRPPISPEGKVDTRSGVQQWLLPPTQLPCVTSFPVPETRNSSTRRRSKRGMTDIGTKLTFVILVVNGGFRMKQTFEPDYP
nr:hypothetical protein [Sphingomonas sp. Y57]